MTAFIFSNILAKVVTFEVVKPLRSSDVTFSQPLNIELISVTFEVSISSGNVIEVRFVQPSNMDCIEVTFSPLNALRSIEVNSLLLQPLNKP